MHAPQTPIALTIAGSDPSAGAGIQADLRMFFAQGVFGMSVLTALTAQNPLEVTAVHPIPASFVAKQLATIHSLPIAAIKTGMLWSADIIHVIAASCAQNPHIPLVIDPVMISTSGHRLIDEQAIEAYRKDLFPIASLITPNLEEAEALLGTSISQQHTAEAAEAIGKQFGCAVLLKGGHMDTDPVDVLFDGTIHRWYQKRKMGINTHGTGCMLSAAVTAHMAKGLSLVEAVHNGLKAVQMALSYPIHITESIALSAIESSGVK